MSGYNYPGLGTGNYSFLNFDAPVQKSPLELAFGSKPVQMSNTRVLPAVNTENSNPSGMLSSMNTWLKDNGVIGYTDKKSGNKFDGWGGLALSAGTGLFNAYMGMKQYGLFKDQLNFQKDSFERNYAAQRSTLNSQLEDRQRARVASNAGAYQSVGEYMDKNRIK